MHANSYSLQKGKEEEKMRSWRGGMKKHCVVQEDKEQGSLIYLFFYNPKGCSGQHAASVNRIQHHPCICNDSHTALTLPQEKKIKLEYSNASVTGFYILNITDLIWH